MMTAAVSSSAATLASLLSAGLDGMKLSLSAAQQEKLLAYVALLAKWNKVYNLTAVREPERMIGLHILDSLAIVPHVMKTLDADNAMMPKPVIPANAGIHTERAPRGEGQMDSRVRGNDNIDRATPPHKRLLDVGSGGGLPGICIAIAAPMLEVVMLDSLQKKTTFVRQAIGELQLDNASVVCERVEKFAPETLFDIVTSRAFAELSDFVNGAAHLVAPHGTMLAMKGVYPHDEIARLSSSVKSTNALRVVDVTPLHVPQIEGARHLVTLRV
jgi:16S rRNA (guanine527-N7)-methyltransferase